MHWSKSTGDAISICPTGKADAAITSILPSSDCPIELNLQPGILSWIFNKELSNDSFNRELQEFTRLEDEAGILEDRRSSVASNG